VGKTTPFTYVNRKRNKRKNNKKQLNDPSQIKNQFDGAQVKKREKQPEMAVF
jgi:hypothetical protein